MKGQKTRQLEGETFAWEILQRNWRTERGKKMALVKRGELKQETENLICAVQEQVL